MSNLYLLSQSFDTGENTFDACVVCAETELEARKIHPYGHEIGDPTIPSYMDGGWAPIDKVHVKLIGTASAGIRKGVIIASYTGGV